MIFVDSEDLKLVPGGTSFGTKGSWDCTHEIVVVQLQGVQKRGLSHTSGNGSCESIGVEPYVFNVREVEKCRRKRSVKGIGEQV